MSKYLNILIFSIFTFFLSAQEIPPIEKFTPEDYHGDNQNWMISQASNKFIYVANHSGLLEYDGAKWKMYTSPNNTVIRAVNVVNDLVYTGCYMEFGYWSKNKLGVLQYQSLIPELDVKMIDDEHIWNIISYEEWVLFQSLNRIYFYNTKTKKFKIINSKNSIGKVYNINNTIYYNVLNVWTSNKEEDLDLFLANDFDYITTDEPELLLKKNKEVYKKSIIYKKL